MRICYKCKQQKDLEDFPKDKNEKLGITYECKECKRLYNKNYYSKNKENRALYFQKNKKKILNRTNLRRKNDLNFRLKCLLRERIRKALKHNFKSGSAVKDLGCTIEELKNYLESKFQPGMTWENRSEWHIDHIKPLANFDLTDRKQLLEACHYTNLQPLWAVDNLRKSDNADNDKTN